MPERVEKDFHSKHAQIYDDGGGEKQKQLTRTARKRTAAQADLDIDPFPDWPSPTPGQCEEVHALLSKLHGDVEAPPLIVNVEAEDTATAKERSKTVLHSLVGTILSCNTTAANCRAAIDGLAREFPSEETWKEVDDGIDYEKVRAAELNTICDAIRPAGLANTRGKNIKTILDMVLHENLERKGEQKGEEIGCSIIKEEHARDHTHHSSPASLTTLSLEHLRFLPTATVQEKLMRFPGVGVKVAACVLLFNLHRPVFAVDTHIFRLSKWLGWVPTEESNEITTFRHLQARIPNQLKYPLHLLLVTHGRQCMLCKAVMVRGKIKGDRGGRRKECVLEHLMERFRKGK
ncbi:hypothetical protein KEM54_005169 [Ascosphaera aggregata]|nr:hypothetical protein KEM54_005169 [Ascosphaera aggregata]